MPVDLWTTEQVAEFLDVDPQSVYESRRRNVFPGNRGVRRGKRLLFPSQAIEEGKAAVERGEDPDVGETTNDANTAILWALQGIKKTLDAIHNELRSQRPQYFDLIFDETTTTTIDIEEEE